jgi:hypothetical protein
MSTTKNIARSLVPPVIWNSLREVRRPARAAGAPAGEHSAVLFGGKPEFLSGLAPRARIYGEYGVGASTSWMAEQTTARIIGVDSSAEWIGKVRATVPPDRADLRHVDVGDLGSWGRPKDYRRRHAFRDYVEGLWTGDTRPDLVLIDGRFRVACFLKSCLEAAPGTPIVVDDYTRRPDYHVMAEFVTPEDVNERQALFVVPSGIDRSRFSEELERFIYVMT